MCPKCLVDQLVGVLQIYMERDQQFGRLKPLERDRVALSLIEEAKAMSHSHDNMVPVEEAEEASRR